MKGETFEIKKELGEQHERQQSEFEEKPKPVANISDDDVVFHRSAFRTFD